MRINIEKQPSKFIKPSVPTPPALRHYKLGFIDELAPSLDVSFVLFFSANTKYHNPKFVTQLQQSLEKTLTRFYPLAGRYVSETNYTVDCNDEGVEFTHAKVNIKLQDILDTDVNVKLVDAFIPSMTRDANRPLLAIQTTMFACGGLSLGVRAAHKVVDASTACTFMNAWAAINREENDYEFTAPGFISSSLFPGRCFQPVPTQPISDDDMSSKYIRKKITFSESEISNMKAKAISTHTRCHLSKVQLVSAIIWKALVAVDQANNNPRDSILLQPVNLREKTASSIPKHSCGNLWGVCVSTAGINVETTEELANRLTENVKKTISNFSKVDHNSIEGQSMVLSSFALPDISKSTNVITISSWCKFPFYEADFGFGKPTWVASGCVPVVNIFYLMDGPRSNGVEAYVLLEVKDLPYFEKALQVYA